MRNTFLKDVRKAWDDSRVLFGRTKIMAKALGTTQEDEYQENMHKLSQVGDIRFTLIKDYSRRRGIADNFTSSKSRNGMV